MTSLGHNELTPSGFEILWKKYKYFYGIEQACAEYFVDGLEMLMFENILNCSPRANEIKVP